MEWWAIQELMITIAVIVGVLVPVFALTYRFVLKPALRERHLPPTRTDSPTEALRDARLDNMERQLEDLEVSVKRLVEVTEFDRQLKAGRPPEEDV
jgi:hypothetical protein